MFKTVTERIGLGALLALAPPPQRRRTPGRRCCGFERDTPLGHGEVGTERVAAQKHPAKTEGRATSKGGPPRSDRTRRLGLRARVGTGLRARETGAFSPCKGDVSDDRSAARSGRCRMVQRTGKINPERPFALGPINSRCVPDCGRRRNATVATADIHLKPFSTGFSPFPRQLPREGIIDSHRSIVVRTGCPSEAAVSFGVGGALSDGSSPPPSRGASNKTDRRGRLLRRQRMEAQPSLRIAPMRSS
jgi:hypothetical protein